MRTSGSLPGFWLTDHWLSHLLSPIGWLYGRVMRQRRLRYLDGRLRSTKLPVPVMVVGNIFVGGTGKTPLVIWLVEQARRQGLKAGVILRGYGGHQRGPALVTPDSNPSAVGDEAILIAQRAGCPVAVGRRRVAAAELLIKDCSLDLLISDDGLQHYALGRDFEIAVIDGERGLGNGRCLPAGPLRERPDRLKDTDLVVANGPVVPESAGQFTLQPGRLTPLQSPQDQAAPGRGARIHAIAGIGHPQRFFKLLAELGFIVVPHAFADHHPYRKEDLSFSEDLPIIMTEKDAVKCRFLAPMNSWFIPVEAQPDPAMETVLVDFLKSLKER